MPAAQPAAAPAVKVGVLTATWSAHPAQDRTIGLRIGDDRTFTWTVTAKGKQKPMRDLETNRGLAMDRNLSRAIAHAEAAPPGLELRRRYLFSVHEPGIAVTADPGSTRAARRI
jgi:hypothetical protein